MPVKPIPEGYHTITPYLVVQGAGALLDFVKKAFDAKEVERMASPDGTIMHAEVTIGDSRLMISDARGESKPKTGMLYLYVKDADATYRRAIQAGASSVMEPADQFYGDRNAGVRDAHGNEWWMATHKEDVPLEEMKKRAEARAKSQS